MSQVNCNIATALDQMAASYPDNTAILYPIAGDPNGEYQAITYQELLLQSNKIATGLTAFGLKPGMRTALLVQPSPDFFALVFALFRAGIVPVLIDPGIGIKNMGACLSQAAPEAFIGIPKAHYARRVLAWAKESVKYNIVVGKSLLTGATSLAAIKTMGSESAPSWQAKPESMAAIVFTSGSTGAPKGVVYEHQQFAAQVELLRKTYGFQPGEKNLPTFPLFALFDPALGMTSVIPHMNPSKPGSVDPLQIIRPIKRFAIANMFGSPALLKRVSDYGVANQVFLPSLKRIISAGAPVPPETMANVRKLITNNAEIFTPYGATEALPISSIGSREILNETARASELGAGVCVGRVLSDNTVSIIPISDEPIANWDSVSPLSENQIGEIVVHGPSVTKQYYSLADATSNAKIHDSRGDTYHRMGDLGYLDTNGRLWFCGRKQHRVELADRVLYSVPCESILNAHPLVKRAALVHILDKNNCNRAAVFIEPACGARAYLKKRKIKRVLIKHLDEVSALNGIEFIYFCSNFPVDIRHNSKIRREELSLRANKHFYRSQWLRK